MKKSIGLLCLVLVLFLAALHVPVPGTRAAAVTLTTLGNANKNDSVVIDGKTWVVVKTDTATTPGKKYVYLIMVGNFLGNAPYGTTTGYDGSTLRANMKWILDTKKLPTIQSIAVKPTLGTHTDMRALTKPTAVMAGSTTQDVLFAPSNGDIWEWINGNTTSTNTAIPSGHPLHNGSSFSFPRRFFCRTAYDANNVTGVNIFANSMDWGILASSAMYAYEVPAVWVDAGAAAALTQHEVLVRCVGTASNEPLTDDVVYHVNDKQSFTLTSPQVPVIGGYQYSSQWKIWSTGAPQNGLPSVASVTADLYIYLIYELDGRFTVTYNANNGTSQPDYIQGAGDSLPVTVTTLTQAATKFTAPAVTPAFKGWNTQPDGSGTFYAAGAPAAFDNSLVLNDNITLYAQWKSHRYLVSKDSNPGVILSTWHELQNAVNYIRDHGVPNQPYTITATEDDLDVNITDHANAVYFWNHLEITLTSDSGGPYVLYQTQNRRHFDIQGELTLKNIILDVATKGGGIFVRNTLNMRDGAILRNCKESQPIGAAVYLYQDKEFANSAVFNMYGGEISGNSANPIAGQTSGGGGVYVPAGTAFNMTGGKISGNTAYPGVGTGTGGGVYVNGGTFAMSGTAEISGNTASTGGVGDGGGVSIAGGGTFNMSGTAAIIHNTGSVNGAGNGGGVFVVGANSTFTMQGTARVSGNTASEKANGFGGGIYISNGTHFTAGGTAEITGNRARNGEGGGIFSEGYDYSATINTSMYAPIVKIDLTVTFNGNRAQAKYSPPSNALALSRFYGKLLNNYDINYKGTKTALICNFTIEGEKRVVAGVRPMLMQGIGEEGMLFSPFTFLTFDFDGREDIWEYANVPNPRGSNLDDVFLSAAVVSMEFLDLPDNFTTRGQVEAYLSAPGGRWAGKTVAYLKDLTDDTASNLQPESKVWAWAVASAKNPGYYELYCGGQNGVWMSASSPWPDSYMRYYRRNTLFAGMSAMTSLDLTHLHTEYAMDMMGMFASCGSLTTVDVSAFNTSSVTDMLEMFKDCYSLTGLDLSSFDTSKIRLMRNMFVDCGALESIDLRNAKFNDDIDSGDMFQNINSGCKVLTSQPSWFDGKNDDGFDLIKAIQTAADPGNPWQNVGIPGGVKFEFTLTQWSSASLTGGHAVYNDIVPVPLKTQVTTDGSGESKSYDYSFDISGLVAGEVYYFKLEESGGQPGWINDPSGVRMIVVGVSQIVNNIYPDYYNYSDDRIFTNTYTTTPPPFAPLTISKTVTGAYGDKTKAFAFTITLKDKDGAFVSGTFSYTGSGSGTLTLVNGVASFTLKHGESIILTGIDPSCQVQIAEMGDANYDTAYHISGSEGDFDLRGVNTGLRNVTSDPLTFAFTNERKSVPETGVSLNGAGALLLLPLLLAAAALIFPAARKARRRRQGAR